MRPLSCGWGANCSCWARAKGMPRGGEGYSGCWWPSYGDGETYADGGTEESDDESSSSSHAHARSDVGKGEKELPRGRVVRLGWYDGFGGWDG